VQRNPSPMLPQPDMLKTHSETFADALKAFPFSHLLCHQRSWRRYAANASRSSCFRSTGCIPPLVILLSGA
jgi:hypothetical protein